jgi:hypothetical protein
MNRFVRQENVKHFERLLSQARTDEERQRIQKLLDEARQCQIDAGDHLGGQELKT